MRQDPRDHCRLLDQRKKPQATTAARAREHTARAFAIVAESGHFARVEYLDQQFGLDAEAISGANAQARGAR